jgi:hypothetical protein
LLKKDGEGRNIWDLYPTEIYEIYYRLGSKNNTLDENKIYKYGNTRYPSSTDPSGYVNYGEGYKRKPLLSFKRGKEYYIITNNYYKMILKEIESITPYVNYYVLENGEYINSRDLANSIYANKKDTSTPEDIQIEIANRTGLIIDIDILKNNGTLSFTGFDEYRSIYKLTNTMSPYNYYDWGFFNLCYSKNDFPISDLPLYQLNDNNEFEIVEKDKWESLSHEEYFNYI